MELVVANVNISRVSRRCKTRAIWCCQGSAGLSSRPTGHSSLVEVAEVVAVGHDEAVIEQALEAGRRLTFGVELDPADQGLVAQRNKLGRGVDRRAVIRRGEVPSFVNFISRPTIVAGAMSSRHFFKKDRLSAATGTRTGGRGAGGVEVADALGGEAEGGDASGRRPTSGAIAVGFLVMSFMAEFLMVARRGNPGRARAFAVRQIRIADLPVDPFDRKRGRSAARRGVRQEGRNRRPVGLDCSLRWIRKRLWRRRG